MRTTLPLFLSATLALFLACSDDSSPKPDVLVDHDAFVDHDMAQSPDAGPTSDTTVDAAVQSDLALDPDGRVILRNVPDPCEPTGAVIPADGEHDHLAATRFTPPYYPFSVESFRYTLDPAPEDAQDESANCDPTLAHEVRVFVDSTAVPSAEPTILWSATNAAGSDATQSRVIEHTLDTPITLQQGERFYVAVQMKREQSGALSCLVACNPQPALQGTDFWSYAAAAPYSWGTMSPVSYIIEAFGR